MAVRGQETKNKIIKTITELFPGAFVSGKELRIEAQEGGELVQIKVALTAAKDNIAHGDVVESRDNNSWTAQPHFDEPTPEEIERIKYLMKEFGFE